MRKMLLILMFIAALVYCLKVLNSDDIGSRPKWHTIRRIMHGAIGSSIFVWASYELLKYYQLPDNLSLAVAGVIGYIGADTLARLIEKILDKLADRVSDEVKLDKK